MGPVSYSLHRLTHLQLVFWKGSEQNVVAFIQHTAITHVITEDLYLERALVSYTRITSLSVTYLVQITISDIESVFPNLQMFSFPTLGTSQWLRSSSHSSLRTIVIDNRAMSSYAHEALWNFLRQHLQAISAERFPSLRSIALKFHAHVIVSGMWSTNKASVDESAAHLRGAGIHIRFES